MWQLRLASIDDAPEIARLACELGYPTPTQAMRMRLLAWLPRPEHHISVAVDADGMLGWIAVEHRLTLESGEYVEIVGLVVDVRSRGTGVGRALVANAELWARQRGLDTIFVRSNVARDVSHAFYEHLGFIRRKTQHCYTKPLNPPG